MKKYLLFTCMASLVCALATAQEKREPSPQQHTESTSFGTDVIIDDTTGADETLVKLTTAFNGWQYAAFSVVDSGALTGGMIIRVSKDGGASWTTIRSYSAEFTTFPAFDIVVAGTDTASLTLYNVGVRNDLLTSTYSLFIDAYKGTTGAFINENYSIQDSVGQIYDVAIASDYTFPALGANPYSLGVLYSFNTPSADSLIFIGSLDGGATWSIKQPVMATQTFFRKVSISYGRSPSASNGRYFGAWEMLFSQADRTGNIYTAHSSGGLDSAWNNPVDLDSISPSMIGLCRNPSIAVSVDDVDNDSSAVTAVVLVDRDSTGNGTNYNLLGFYNMVAHYSNFWNRLNVMNSSQNDMQPDIVYCTGTSQFFSTYFDSTDQYLPFIQNDLNLLTPNSWTYVSTWYNDVAANLIHPYPQVSVIPVVNLAAVSWIQNNGTIDLALFDSDGSTVSIPGVVKSGSGLTIFPNPAVHDINISVSLSSPSGVRVDILNSLGQLIFAEDLGTLNAGTSNQLINIDALANGNYFVKVTGDRFVKTEKMMIVK